jgi:cytosine/adenosine deaminase-related metal-dependent hydrolase
MAAPAGAPAFDAGRPLVFRSATVVTVDSAGVLENADVLVIDDLIAAVGHRLEVPEGTVEIDATGGILMPGMIDTHRHMWQSMMRGYGGDWALSQYFNFYYLNHGSVFRPDDIRAGNRLSALESVDTGVTTTLDWSHGLRTIEHAEAAVDALRSIPGRFVLGYGDYLGAPWEWSTSADFRSFAERTFSSSDSMLTLELAFDVIGQEGFPEEAAFRAARDLGVRVSTHAGVWGATTDVAIDQMYAAGVMTDEIDYVHCATLSQESYQKIAATGGSASVATESEQNAGQGYPSTWQLRKHGIPTSLSMDTSVWWGADFFSAMRATLSSDRSREHLEAQAKNETVVANALRAEDVVRYATIGGARAIGREDSLGSITVGKKADLVLVKNDESPAMTPILNPWAHLVFQAGTADIHTVVIDGRVVKYAGERIGLPLAPVRDEVAASVEHVRRSIGEEAWAEGMHPAIPAAEDIPNPYRYAEWDGTEQKVTAQKVTAQA